MHEPLGDIRLSRDIIFLIFDPPPTPTPLRDTSPSQVSRQVPRSAHPPLGVIFNEFSHFFNTHHTGFGDFSLACGEL